MRVIALASGSSEAFRVAGRRPSQQLGTEHEERHAGAQDERAVGEVRQGGVVEEVGARPRLDPLGVELRVDRVGADLIRVELAPDLAEPDVVLAAAERARAVPGRERRRLVEEEQLGEPAGLQQRLAVPAAEPETARDPPLAVEPPADPAPLIVQAPTVAVHETATGFGDQLAERGDTVPQRHQGQRRRARSARSRSEGAFVRAEQRPVPHDRLALDEHVPRPAVGPEDQPGERVGHVAEVVAGPDDEIGSEPGLEPAEVVPAEASGPALGREPEGVRRQERVGAAGALPRGVESLAQLGLEPAHLVGRDPIDTQTDGRPCGLEIDDTAHPGAQARVARRAVRDPRPRGAEPSHLGVVEVDPVRHPHVVVDPPELVEQIHRAPAEAFEHVAFLVDGLGEVGVQPQAVPSRERRGLAHQLRRHAERAARRDGHHDALAVVVAGDHRFGRGQDRVEVLDDVVGRETAAGLAQVHRASREVHADPHASSRRRRSRRTPCRRRGAPGSGGRPRSCTRSARARRAPPAPPPGRPPRRAAPRPGRARRASRTGRTRRTARGSSIGTGGGGCSRAPR